MNPNLEPQIINLLKTLQVRAAEADAEAKHLSGKGTAAMRQAITEGFRGSIESMKESCGLEPKEVGLGLRGSGFSVD